MISLARLRARQAGRLTGPESTYALGGTHPLARASPLEGRAHFPEGVLAEGRFGGGSSLPEVLPAAPGGLGVLPAHADPPVVPEPTVEADLLHPLQVLTKVRVQQVRVLLARLSILDVALPVEHPCWDAVLDRVRDHRDDLVDLVGGDLPGALAWINVALFAYEVREAAPDAFDGGEREHHLLPAVDIRVAHPQDVLEVLALELH